MSFDNLQRVSSEPATTGGEGGGDAAPAGAVAPPARFDASAIGPANDTTVAARADLLGHWAEAELLVAHEVLLSELAGLPPEELLSLAASKKRTVVENQQTKAAAIEEAGESYSAVEEEQARAKAKREAE